MTGELLDEFVMADGLVSWCAHGPGTQMWVLMWNPGTQVVRAWKVPGGRDHPHREQAASLADARGKALIIAEERNHLS